MQHSSYKMCLNKMKKYKFSLFVMLCSLSLFSLGSCKKESGSAAKKGITGKIVCEDCLYVLQIGNKQIKNESQGAHNVDIDIPCKSGDTVLFAGWNYSISKNMDGYIYNKGTEVKHGITHCGGNPSFFLQYIVP